MAVAYGTSAISSASASQDSFTITFTPSGTPRGICVFVFTNADADYITSVTYGSTTMTQVGEAADTGGEAGRTTAFFLGSSIPSGQQTITVTRTNNATSMIAVALNVTAAQDTAVHADGVKTQVGDGAAAEESVDDGSPGQNSLRVAGTNSGLSGIVTNPGDPGTNNLSNGANSTWAQSNDWGARVVGVVYESAVGQGARNIGFVSATSDDRAALHFAIFELAAPREASPQDAIIYTTDSPDARLDFLQAFPYESATVAEDDVPWLDLLIGSAAETPKLTDGGVTGSERPIVGRDAIFDVSLETATEIPFELSTLTDAPLAVLEHFRSSAEDATLSDQALGALEHFRSSAETPVLTDGPPAPKITSHLWPSSLTVPTGTLVGGDVESLWRSDNNQIEVTEVGGAPPGFEVRATWTGVPEGGAAAFRLVGWYNGSLGHTVVVQQWSFVAGDWTATLLTLPTETSEQTYLEGLAGASGEWISSGEIRLRIYHSSPGNITHTQYVDEWVLTEDPSHRAWEASTLADATDPWLDPLVAQPVETLVLTDNGEGNADITRESAETPLLTDQAEGWLDPLIGDVWEQGTLTDLGEGSVNLSQECWEDSTLVDVAEGWLDPLIGAAEETLLVTDGGQTGSERPVRVEDVPIPERVDTEPPSEIPGEGVETPVLTDYAEGSPDLLTGDEAEAPILTDAAQGVLEHFREAAESITLAESGEAVFQTPSAYVTDVPTAGGEIYREASEASVVVTDEVYDTELIDSEFPWETLVLTDWAEGILDLVGESFEQATLTDESDAQLSADGWGDDLIRGLDWADARLDSLNQEKSEFAWMWDRVWEVQLDFLQAFCWEDIQGEDIGDGTADAKGDVREDLQLTDVVEAWIDPLVVDKIDVASVSDVVDAKLELVVDKGEFAWTWDRVWRAELDGLQTEASEGPVLRDVALAIVDRVDGQGAESATLVDATIQHLDIVQASDEWRYLLPDVSPDDVGGNLAPSQTGTDVGDDLTGLTPTTRRFYE